MSSYFFQHSSMHGWVEQESNAISFVVDNRLFNRQEVWQHILISCEIYLFKSIEKLKNQIETL